MTPMTIHYPECWDTAAYPTFESALNEVYAAFSCTVCTHPRGQAASPDATSATAHLSPSDACEDLRDEALELANYFESQSHSYTASDRRFDAFRLLRRLADLATEALSVTRISAAPSASSVPEDVRAALDRMCTPMDESWLSGATAKEDARCMALIRNHVLAAPPANAQLHQQLADAKDGGTTQTHGRAIAVKEVV